MMTGSDCGEVLLPPDELSKVALLAVQIDWSEQLPPYEALCGKVASLDSRSITLRCFDTFVLVRGTPLVLYFRPQAKMSSSCRCGNCQIQLLPATMGSVSPTVFKRFLSQALTDSKKQAAQDCGVAAVNPGLCWISCRGETRSLTFDLVGPALSLDAQRKQNVIKVLELGKHYIFSRASLSVSDTQDAMCAGNYAKTLSRIGMDEGIRHIEDDGSMRLRDILRYLRVVKVNDDITERRNI